MKTRTLIFSLTSILFLALTTCKKDPQPIMERFDLSREDLTIGTTSAIIVGTYAYSGAIDEIMVCVSEDGVHPATFAADINGKNYTVEMTGLRPATSYQYYYSVDYGFSKPFTTEAKSFTTLSELPTVRTIDVTSIDSTTVRVKCEVVAEGGEEVTERGICWNTFGDPTLDDETMQHASGGVGQYTLRLEGLALSTKYYVRAYARNASGIGFGEVLEFETLAEAQVPEVSTVEVNGVTSTTATCMGNVASDGGLELIERGVCWSLSANPTTSGSHAIATDATMGVYQVTMTGLTPNKTYHVRAYATNAKGTAYGDDLTFTTTEGLPVVTTSGITEISATSAKGGGEVTDQGASNVTERGICWGTSHNPTTSGTHASNGTGAGSYTVSMTNLTPNATYYVRAYATNSQGTAYGAEVSFTALEGLPVVLTLDMTDITSTTAKGHGKVSDQGGSAVTERGICWSTSPSPTTSGSHANSGTGTGEYTVSISNLTPGTKYYVRAYATNSQGTTYGEQKDFTTAANLPTVTTDAVSNITQTTAQGGGNVTNSGGATITERGICWSTSHNPTTSGSHANSGTGTGSFTVNMNGLTANTTYYVRAYAINSQGISYGSEVYFTTLSNTGYFVDAIDDWDISACQYVPVDVDVLSNDIIEPNANDATVTIVSTPSYGTASVLTNKKIRYEFSGGNYTTDQLKYRVTNHGVTDEAWVHINTENPPQVGDITAPTAICAGGVLGIDVPSINPSGTGQWQKSTSQNGTYQAFDPNNIPLSMNGNWVRYSATNDCGEGHSNSVQITVTNGPTFTGQTPQIEPICAGESLNLNAPAYNANGSQILSQGWVASQTEDGTYTTFNVNNIPISYNGWYVRYMIESSCGEVLSAPARQLTVIDCPSCPTGAINGLFTINANGDQVYFSQGNLQYQASTNTWRFAENQYDYVGDDNANISPTYNGWIDLFGWGTGNNPTNSSGNYGNYSSFHEWGDNSISNGGNQAGLWRTLTKDEWHYILKQRATPSGKRYVKAQVNGVNGVIVLPDNWSNSTYSLNNANDASAFTNYTDNTLTASQWIILEQVGAIFLPAAGNRYQTSVGNFNTDGCYWSASYYDTFNAFGMTFAAANLISMYQSHRQNGYSVRLVSPAY